jgi:putative nucleotidyltransferase with HDIG domain
MYPGEQRISIEQVRVGLFIRLETWIDNPFLFRSFKIRNEKQLDVLRSLGLSEVFYSPEKSDAAPLPRLKAVAPVVPSPLAVDPDVAAILQAKQARREKHAQQRETYGRCEKQFIGGISTVKALTRNLFSQPQAAIEQAQALVACMTDSLSSDQDVLVYMMNARSSDEGAYYHALNVTVLALMLGCEAGLQAGELNALGLGTLLHDIGKERIPSQILLKKTAWTNAERNFYLQHVAYGVEMAEKLPNLPPGALEVIAQHHEMLDGSGFPGGLGTKQIGKLARIAAIANAFDNACNRICPADSLTPAQALSVMLTRDRNKYDAVLMEHFVRCLGMYPPGSIVRLNSGAIGLVVSVNAEKLMQPTLLLYDPAVPKKEALLLDLADAPDLSVVSTLRPSELPRPVWNYLNPRSCISYLSETTAPVRELKFNSGRG